MEESRGKRVFATVDAIIEREADDKLEVLLQLRWKEKGDKTYDDTFELPGGHIEEEEDFYSALKREVKEETGLDVTEIKPNIATAAVGRFDKKSISAVPFCVNRFVGASRLCITFICKAKGELIKKGVYDAKEPRWVSFSKLKEMLKSEPKSFFPQHLAALKFYVSQKEKKLI